MEHDEYYTAECDECMGGYIKERLPNSLIKKEQVKICANCKGTGIITKSFMLWCSAEVYQD